jgi:hypothetical protein
MIASNFLFNFMPKELLYVKNNSSECELKLDATLCMPCTYYANMWQKPLACYVRRTHWCFNEALLHEDIRGSDCINPHILNIGPRWRRLVGFMSNPLYLQGKSPPYTCWIGGWAGPRASLNNVEKRKISYSCHISNPYSSVMQPMASHCADWAIPAPQ